MKRLKYPSLFVTLLLLSSAWAQTAKQNPLLITGQVLDEQDRPVSGATVSAHIIGGLKGRLPMSTSDLHGKFTLAVNQTGSYRVTAAKPVAGYPSPFNPFYNPTEDLLTPVLVKEDLVVPFATVRLMPKTGKLVIRIVDSETKQAVNDVQVTLCRAESPKYCHRLADQNPDKQFDTLVPLAPFTLQISAPGYKDWYGLEGTGEQPLRLQVASGTTKLLSVFLERSQTAGEGLNEQRLAAPQPLFPVDGAEFSHYPRTTKLEWSAVPGATSYTVELEVCLPGGADGKACESPRLLQMRENPPLSGIQTTSYEFLFIGSQPGRWRVWAVDAQGRAGKKSAWSNFFYVYKG